MQSANSIIEILSEHVTTFSLNRMSPPDSICLTSKQNRKIRETLARGKTLTGITYTKNKSGMIQEIRFNGIKLE